MYRYQIDLEGNPPGLRGRAAVIHRVAPFTALTTRFRWQDSMGRTALEMRGDIHPHRSTEDGWHTSALTMLHVERILFAINDEPFAVTLDGSYRFHPSTRQLQETHEVRGTLGLSLLWQL